MTSQSKPNLETMSVRPVPPLRPALPKPSDGALVLGLLSPFVLGLVGAFVSIQVNTAGNFVVCGFVLIGCFISYSILKKYKNIAIYFGIFALGFTLLGEMPREYRFGGLIGIITGMIGFNIAKKKAPAYTVLITSAVIVMGFLIAPTIKSGIRSSHSDQSSPTSTRGSESSLSINMDDPTIAEINRIYWNGIRNCQMYSINPQLFEEKGRSHIPDAIIAFENAPKEYPMARVGAYKKKLILGLRVIEFQSGGDRSIHEARVALGDEP